MSDSEDRPRSELDSVDELIAPSPPKPKKNGAHKRVRFRSKDQVFPSHEKSEE